MGGAFTSCIVLGEEVALLGVVIVVDAEEGEGWESPLLREKREIRGSRAMEEKF